MGRRSRKTKKRLNSMLLALLLTAVMLVMSTYAWFSANRTVSITGLTAKVSAAEGLQISLDGATWGSSVEVNETTLAAAASFNNYVLPTELHPVSTTGLLDGAEVQFFDGQVNAEGTKLTGADEAEASEKFIVFDVYLKNSSSQTNDNLQLATNSEVKIGATSGKEGVTGTGLENSVRIAFALYPNTATFTAGQSAIASLTGSPAVSIWEPNYSNHITEVVNNDTRVASNATFVTLGLKSAGNGTLDGINGTSATTFMEPTTTVRTPGKVTGDTPLTATNTAQLQLAGNKISKVRVYIWLEGQDPDCIDTASTGKYLDFVINLSKPGLNAATTS